MPRRHMLSVADRGINTHHSDADPHLALLHGSMLLAGYGTVFLGPVLPRLAAAAHTTDSGSGLFFTAQFLGAFLGGVTTSARLWRSLLRGCSAAIAGFFLLGLCVTWHATLPWCTAALLPLGFGVGQILTTINLLTSKRYPSGRGAALSRVNFSWSLGAVLAPFLLIRVLGAVPLQWILFASSGLFLLAAAVAVWNAKQHGGHMASATRTETVSQQFRLIHFVYFATLLFLYGGVETALSGWTTTFGQRYSSGAAGALSTTVLWLGLTTGRACTTVLLRAMRERVLLIASLAMATALTVLLSRSHGGMDMLILCALLGLSLAPWFPLVFAEVMRAGAAATQAGSIIAVSGIGAAMLPLLVGGVSRSTGSLRIALSVPAAGLAVLLLLSFYQVPAKTSEPELMMATPGGV